MARVHIIGASGSGTTTLGAALAAAMGVPHVDSDTYFWTLTDPPYSVPRPPAERVALMRPVLEQAPSWVWSGAATAWGAPLEHLFSHIVFLHLPQAVRMQRLHAREAARHGARIAPGGDMHAGSREFLDWAERYDTAGAEQRSRFQQEAWLATQTVPVLRLDSSAPLETLRSRAMGFVGRVLEPQ